MELLLSDNLLNQSNEKTNLISSQPAAFFRAPPLVGRTRKHTYWPYDHDVGSRMPIFPAHVVVHALFMLS